MQIACLIFLTFSFYSPLFSSPKAVVFDFGGVMTKQADEKAVRSFIGNKWESSQGNVKPKKAKESNIDPRESLSRFLQEMLGINEGMYELAKELKEQKVLLVMLSNIDVKQAKLMRDHGFFDVFDLCFLSFELGLEKPDIRIYEKVKETLCLEGEEILFFDDRIENVQGASLAGWDSLLFESEKQARLELYQKGIGVKLL